MHMMLEFLGYASLFMIVVGLLFFWCMREKDDG